MIDKEKLHQILSSLWKNDDSAGKTYYNQALQDVQIAIDLQEEEHVSEDLEREIEGIRKYHFINDDFDKAKLDGRTISNIARHFAEWQKQQLMAKAIDGTIRPDDGEIWFDFKLFNFEDGDKVKVIIIKEG